MAVAALVVLVAWLVLVIAVRSLVTYRRSGTVPTPPPAPPGSPQRSARLAASVGLLLAFATPIAELLGLAPIEALDQAVTRALGLGLAVAGIGGTIGSQLAMGDAWRPDIDPTSTAPLVTTGPFAIVRNPILACTLVVATGFALMVPNVLALLMAAAFLTSVEIQARRVEEPFLLQKYGDEYRRYAAVTGRFVPGIGRMR